MDSILLVASLASFFVLMVAWLALPHSGVGETPSRVSVSRKMAAEA